MIEKISALYFYFIDLNISDYKLSQMIVETDF